MDYNLNFCFMSVSCQSFLFQLYLNFCKLFLIILVLVGSNSTYYDIPMPLTKFWLCQKFRITFLILHLVKNTGTETRTFPWIIIQLMLIIWHWCCGTVIFLIGLCRVMKERNVCWYWRYTVLLIIYPVSLSVVLSHQRKSTFGTHPVWAAVNWSGIYTHWPLY